MTKAPSSLQDLRRRIYRKAKSEKTHRFWGLFVHVTKSETLMEAYRQAKRNGGAPGIDGVSFADIEGAGLAAFIASLSEDLRTGRYQPQPNRRVAIPKANGKVRVLQIPCIRDRVVQGALKLILEAIFEADFCPNSYGFRPKRSPHRALAEVRRSVLRRMSTVIDVDLSSYFDTLDHDLLMRAVCHHTEEPWVRLYIERWLRAPVQLPDGSLQVRDQGTPQGGVASPLLANLFLHYAFDAWMQRNYPQVPFERYADDALCHCRTQEEAEHLKAALAQRFADCHLELHPEKTKVVYCKDDDRRLSTPAPASTSWAIPFARDARKTGGESTSSTSVRRSATARRRRFANRSEAGSCRCAVIRTLTIWHGCSTRSSGGGSTTTAPSTSRRCIRPCDISTANWPSGPHASSSVCAVTDDGPSSGCARWRSASLVCLRTGA